MLHQQKILLWTGGIREHGDAYKGKTDSFPQFPAPAPLRLTAIITYHWGQTKFEIAASACSIRMASWGNVELAWLHCKAVQTLAIIPNETVSNIAVLIPAEYVTGILPGPAFKITKSHQSPDIGVFPPVHPSPPGVVPLNRIEAVIAELLAPELN